MACAMSDAMAMVASLGDVAAVAERRGGADDVEGLPSDEPRAADVPRSAPPRETCSPLSNGAIVNSEYEAAGRAKPQRVAVRGKRVRVWPEFWGISIHQCRRLMAHCRSDPRWSEAFTMRDLVERYVKPMTRGSGVGYALKQNLATPLEVNVMVSHAWDENAGEFFAALERSVHEHDIMFICALSLYQCEDGCGPTIAQQLGTDAEESPFRRVLDHIRRRCEESWQRQLAHDILRVGWHSCILVSLFVFYYPIGAAHCIPTLNGCAVGRRADSSGHTLLRVPNCWFPQWVFDYGDLDERYTGFLPASIVMIAASVVLRLIDLMVCRYRGFMIAVPNRECDLYSRLWCVYEIFVACKLGVRVKIARTLASAGSCRWEDAHCSNGCDRDRIRMEILSWAPPGGIWSRKDAAERVDAAIRKVTRFARYSMAATLASYVFPYCLMQVAMSVEHIRTFGSIPPMSAENVCDGFFSIAIGGAVVMAMTFQIAKLRQGIMDRLTCLLASIFLLVAGVSLSLIGSLIDKSTPGSVGPSHWPVPFHHCFITTLIWDGVALAVLTELHCLLHLSTRARVVLVVALLVLSITVYVLWASLADWSADQIYPLAVWFVSFRAMPMLGVPSFFLLSAETWGIRFVSEPIWRGCPSPRCPRRQKRGSAASPDAADLA